MQREVDKTIPKTLPLRLEPQKGSENCACHHPYWQHYITRAAFEHVPNTSDALEVARGESLDTGCGGFFPAAIGTALNAQSTCLCGAAYIHHMPEMQQV